MKKLVCPAHGQVEMIDVPDPGEPAVGYVLVNNQFGAEKHGTMESFVHKHGNARGSFDFTRRMHLPGEGIQWNYPIPLGNMQVGTVSAVGSEVTDVAPGDRVVYYGAFAPRGTATASRTWKLAPDVPWQSAVCLDPAVYALCALREAGARVGDAVAIFSLGAIGLSAVALARLAGCSPVIAIDPIAKRRDVASSLGADVTLDPAGIDTGARLRELTDWRGCDVVIEYSGSVPALNAALRGVAFGGTIACGAFPGPYAAGLDFGAEAHMNRPNIVFTRTESEPLRDHPNWNLARYRNTVMRMINAGEFDGTLIVDPVIPYNDQTLAEEYERIMADKAHAVKMGVDYGA